MRQFGSFSRRFFSRMGRAPRRCRTSRCRRSSSSCFSQALTMRAMSVVACAASAAPVPRPLPAPSRRSRAHTHERQYPRLVDSSCAVIGTVESHQRMIGPNLAGGWPEVVYNAPKLARFGISARDGCFPTPKNLPNHRPSTPVGSAETHNTPHRPNSRFWRHTGARGPRRLLQKV